MTEPEKVGTIFGGSGILPRRKEAVVEDLQGELHRSNRRIDLLIDEREYWKAKAQRLEAELNKLKETVISKSQLKREAIQRGEELE